MDIRALSSIAEMLGFYLIFGNNGFVQLNVKIYIRIKEKKT